MGRSTSESYRYSYVNARKLYLFLTFLKSGLIFIFMENAKHLANKHIQYIWGLKMCGNVTLKTWSTKYGRYLVWSGKQRRSIPLELTFSAGNARSVLLIQPMLDRTAIFCTKFIMVCHFHEVDIFTGVITSLCVYWKWRCMWVSLYYLFCIYTPRIWHAIKWSVFVTFWTCFWYCWRSSLEFLWLTELTAGYNYTNWRDAQKRMWSEVYGPL